nr:BNR repeat-containing protein [Asticcacaulis aquaticus]
MCLGGVVCLLCPGLAFAQTGSSRSESPPTAARADVSPEAIDRVWSGHSVKFALTASKTHLYVAYYDANRQLTVAQRPLNNPAHWVYHKVDTWLGWDSHNLIALAVDNAGAVHVAANMHVDPLTYFRSDPGGDVRTLKRVPVLVNAAREQAMTYPIFLKNAEGRLILKYRDGSSGRGNEIYTIYDEAMQSWRALTDAPLVDGEGRMNAYFMGPVQGADGYFHIAWVWRDSPQAETNHDLSYARSRDLIHWERADGTPLPLPIRLKDAEIVDPVPVKGGMINNNTIIGFDDRGRVMITYHKYDAVGNTQIWVARYDKGWKTAQVSAWMNYRWDFKGTGSLNSELFVEGVRPGAVGKLIVPVVRLGQPIEFEIDAQTLKLIVERPVESIAEALRGKLDAPADMLINVAETTASDGTVYRLGWAAKAPNRDRPLEAIPAPTDLKLFVYKPEKP